MWLSAGSQREPARSRRVRPHRALSTAQGSFCSNKQLRKTFTAELKIVRTRIARPLACPTVTHVAPLAVYRVYLLNEGRRSSASESAEHAASLTSAKPATAAPPRRNCASMLAALPLAHVISLSLLVPPARLPTLHGGGAVRCSAVPAVVQEWSPQASLLTPVVSRASRAPPPRMQEAPFWQNVERFARFFISSVAGLILQLLSPFAIFSRSPVLAAVGATLFVGILVFLYLTLTSMQAPLDVAVAREAARDPSMQSMLNDIYGPGN